MTRGKHKPARRRPRPPVPAALPPEPSPEPVEISTSPGPPIVGIGASAGGLEALEAFLSRVPVQSGAAFVIVQHLDPSHRGMFVELLQRATAMPVVEAGDGMVVEADHAYVIPPGKDISVLHGELHLLPQLASRGRVLPIDFFFRSLALDRGERGIGVILSGMGTDGTLGARAIKEAGGVVFVQAPASAKFDSMPRNAIEAGVVDVIAPVEELPSKIVSYRDRTTTIASDLESHQDARGAIEKVCVLLREYSGNDFSVYKRSTIYRRIERRMALHQVAGFPAYLRILRENHRELEQLFEELLIGVTSFFRDPAEWDRLRKELVPGLVAARASGGALRAWVAGCSTGEEAYSLAIVLKEALDTVRSPRKIAVQIFATDLDRGAIERARIGIYPESIAADVSPERLRRFFVRDEQGYRVNKDIRETVVFAPQNVIVDPPFTKVDIVSCRNLLIYLSSEVQKQLIPLFHYCLEPGGVLFLGTAETIGTNTNLFSPIDTKTRLFRRLEQPAAVRLLELGFRSFGRIPNALGDREEPPLPTKAVATNVQTLVDRVLVQRFAPLGLLCNSRGDLLHASGRPGKFLEPPVGKPTFSVFAMARDGLRDELPRAFAKALRQDKPVHVGDIEIGSDGETRLVELTVQKLVEPAELAGTVIVVLAETAGGQPAPKKGRRGKPRQATKIADELLRSREEVQTIREEMQTSQEELKSTNEELQSTNEELQSTNEELTTSKEEMQSLNEELTTVNHELQAKVDELSRTNNDMRNLLNSTDIATLFLDAELRVRRFTTATAKIIKLIPADVGRPITDLASDLDYPGLADDARDVLRTLIFVERQAVTRDGRAFSVRLIPYRTLDNVIDGVVITFTDASAARALEIAEHASQLRQMAESLPNLVWGARSDGGFDYLSRQWATYTGVPESEQLGWGWLDRVHPADRDAAREGWRTAVRTGSALDLEFRIRATDGSYRWFKTRAVPIRHTSDAIVKWYGTSTDIDTLKRVEDRLSAVVAGLREGLVEVDDRLGIVAANPAAERLVGRPLVGAALADAVPDLEAKIRAAATDAELDLAGGTVAAHIERSDRGFLIFMLAGGS